MRLKSDFIDYYDHHFNGHGQVFERLSTGGMSRLEMFRFLEAHNIKVPVYGEAGRLYTPVHPYKKVVVYTDETAHRGEGKLLLSMLVAMYQFPKCLASYYISEQSTISYRHLQIGRYQFRLLYHSQTDKWRSNVGDVEIKIIDRSEGYHPTIKEPLFAIDYVKEGEEYYAVDFNIAPQIKGTGVEDLLTPNDIVSAITEPLSKANGW